MGGKRVRAVTVAAEGLRLPVGGARAHVASGRIRQLEVSQSGSGMASGRTSVGAMASISTTDESRILGTPNRVGIRIMVGWKATKHPLHGMLIVVATHVARVCQRKSAALEAMGVTLKEYYVLVALTSHR